MRLLPVPDTAGDARGSELLIVKRVAVVAMEDNGGREDENEVEDGCEVCVDDEGPGLPVVGDRSESLLLSLLLSSVQFRIDVNVFCLRPSFLKKRALVVVPGLSGDMGDVGVIKDDDEPAPCPGIKLPSESAGPVPPIIGAPLGIPGIEAEVGDMIIAVFAGMDSC